MLQRLTSLVDFELLLFDLRGTKTLMHVWLRPKKRTSRVSGSSHPWWNRVEISKEVIDSNREEPELIIPRHRLWFSSAGWRCLIVLASRGRWEVKGDPARQLHSLWDTKEPAWFHENKIKSLKVAGREGGAASCLCQDAFSRKPQRFASSGQRPAHITLCACVCKGVCIIFN